MKLINCICIVAIVFLLPFSSELSAEDNLQQRGLQALQSFRDYSQKIKTLKICCHSYGVDSVTNHVDQNDSYILLNIVCDFFNKKKKEMFYDFLNNSKSKITEQLYDNDIHVDLTYHDGDRLEVGDEETIYLMERNNSPDHPDHWYNDFVFYFFGHIFFESSKSSFWNSVDKMKVSAAEEKQDDDNEKIFFLSLQNDKQKINLWLSPARQWCPKRIVWQQVPLSPSRPSIVSLKIEYSNFEQDSEICFPRTALVEMTMSSVIINNSDGEKITIPSATAKRKLEIVDCKINSKLNDKDFDFSIPVPNGMRVFLEDEKRKHIQHVWNNGKIEPKTNELMLKIARGNHKFIPGVEEPRFWIMALGVIFIIVGFSLKVKSLIQQWREK